ncbi:MAG: polyhydroxybutyrate depolymerase [Pseudomonadota bacterium]
MSSSSKATVSSVALVALAVCGAATLAAPANACGRESDCALGERSFRIALPDNDPPRGAIVYAHGHLGSAEGAMRNDALVELAQDLNLAFVAAQGMDGMWNTPNNPGGDTRRGDELAYFDALASALEADYGIPSERTFVSGFSSGAMLVWNLACERGDVYAGFAPLSGTFWAPVPDTCPTIPNGMMHFHGTEDKIVPMEGRAIRDSRQSDIADAFIMLENLSDYSELEKADGGDDLTCSHREDSAGRTFDVCYFPGGHSFRTEFFEMAAEAFLPRNSP